MLPKDFPPVSTVCGYFYDWRDRALLATINDLLVHAADIQDRDGAPMVLKVMRFRFPWPLHIFADGGYAGDRLRGALTGHGDWTIEIIKRSDAAKGFEVLPRRWVAARTFAWLGRSRRCQGLGKIHRERQRLDPHRSHQDAHKAKRKLFCLLMNF